jgi:hypothetical protein
VAGVPQEGGLRDQRGHHVRVHVGRRPPVLEVACNKPRKNPHGSAA